MMYTNLIWMWGHPEVYILMLPALGVFSEIVSTFSRKPIASYKSNFSWQLAVYLLLLYQSGCTTSSRWVRAPMSTHSSEK